MPEISLLEPMVLRGVVEKFTAPENLVMLSRLPRDVTPFPTVTWDVIRGSRMVSTPNVPNAEAYVVPHLGRSQETATLLTLRDKKAFNPTTLRWLREPGEIARVNAEKAVLREVKDLNQRMDNFAELSIWSALTGHLVIDNSRVQADIDYKFPASHLPTVGTGWDTATPAQIVADVKAWKRLISRDGRVEAREAFASQPTLDLIFNSFATTGVANTFLGASLLSDRAKDEYYRSGTLPGFMGLNWNVIETVYDDPDGNMTQFVPDNALFLGNYTDQRPIVFVEGPIADHDAPMNYTGKFAKSWFEEDPSVRQYLIDWSFLPVIERPEQMIYVENVLTP